MISNNIEKVKEEFASLIDSERAAAAKEEQERCIKMLEDFSLTGLAEQFKMRLAEVVRAATEEVK